MKIIKLAAASLNQTPFAWKNNADNILSAIQLARDENCSFLCLPELAISSYGCEDFFLSPSVQQKSLQYLEKIIPATQGIVVCLGLPMLFKNSLFNVICVVANRRIQGFVPKSFLAGDFLHYEPRYFKAWKRKLGHLEEIKVFAEAYPFGSTLFSASGVRFGLEICEEAWVINRPGIELAKNGTQIILNPSASHFAIGKYEKRKKLIADASRAFGLSYVYSNLNGNEAGRVIYDGGCIIASCGEILQTGTRLSFKNVNLVHTSVDLESQQLFKSSNFNNYEIEEEEYSKVEPVSFDFDFLTKKDLVSRVNSRLDAQIGSNCSDKQNTNSSQLAISSKEGSVSQDPSKDTRSFVSTSSNDLLLKDMPGRTIETDYQEFSYAVALGLFDYLKKSSHQSFTLSLSGGADSSAVAILVALMFKLAVAELGEKKFKEELKLQNVNKTTDTDSEGLKKLQKETVGSSLDKAEGGSTIHPTILFQTLLTCAYQKTSNNSPETLKSAKSLAKELGATYLELNIDSVVKQYVKIVEKEMGYQTSWQKDDLALQNIQARVRSPSIWLIANLKRSILLTTSNRSEVAVGYATMDGDTSGGLAPIAGVSKTFIKNWLRWVEKGGLKALGKVKSLKYVNQLSPSAELRPATEDGGKTQTDESDLMPYFILDKIENLAINDKKSPREIIEILSREFDNSDLNSLNSGDQTDLSLQTLNLDKKQLEIFVKKFFKLWSISQWKRERYAPSFHLEGHNLDPRSWCRFPILNANLVDDDL